MVEDTLLVHCTCKDSSHKRGRASAAVADRRYGMLRAAARMSKDHRRRRAGGEAPPAPHTGDGAGRRKAGRPHRGRALRGAAASGMPRGARLESLVVLLGGRAHGALVRHVADHRAVSYTHLTLPT